MTLWFSKGLPSVSILTSQNLELNEAPKTLGVAGNSLQITHRRHRVPVNLTERSFHTPEV